MLREFYLSTVCWILTLGGKIDLNPVWLMDQFLTTVNTYKKKNNNFQACPCPCDFHPATACKWTVYKSHTDFKAMAIFSCIWTVYPLACDPRSAHKTRKHCFECKKYQELPRNKQEKKKKTFSEDGNAGLTITLQTHFNSCRFLHIFFSRALSLQSIVMSFSTGG